MDAEEETRLFVYGTLRRQAVQGRVFGRRMRGSRDTLEGYIKFTIKLGPKTYPIISPQKGAVVEGTVLTITLAELKKADAYETSAYVRREVTLRSGKRAWVYQKPEAQP